MPKWNNPRTAPQNGELFIYTDGKIVSQCRWLEPEEGPFGCDGGFWDDDCSDTAKITGWLSKPTEIEI